MLRKKPAVISYPNMNFNNKYYFLYFFVLPFVCLFFLVALNLQVGWAEIKHLTVNLGEQIHLLTEPDLKLEGEAHIVWYVHSGHQTEGLKETVINYEAGKKTFDPPRRFQGKLQLDHKTAALTIGPLGFEHSGIYQGDIYDENDHLHSYIYDVTVLALHPVIPAPRPPLTTDRHRYILAVLGGIFGVLVLLVVTGLVVRARKSGKNKEPHFLTEEDEV